MPAKLPAAIESTYDLGATNLEVLLQESDFALSDDARTLTPQSGRRILMPHRPFDLDRTVRRLLSSL
jgi:hypothetical protein